jgi:hypothetical protein
MIPDEVEFATKLVLAQAMLARGCALLWVGVAGDRVLFIDVHDVGEDGEHLL